MPAKSLYVCRKLTNPTPLVEWASATGVANLLAPGELHVTQVYSRAEMDWDAVPPDPDTVIVPAGGERSVQVLGPKGAVVLAFDSDALQERFSTFERLGASHDFPAYMPHVTIGYQPGFDVATIRPFEGEIAFGPEEFSELDEDWADRLLARKSNSQYSIPRAVRGLSDSSKLEVTGRVIAPQQTKVFPMSTRALAALAKIFKSMPEGALADLEQIPDYTDNNGAGKNEVPSLTDIGADARTLPMRGAAATSESERNGSNFPQSGITELTAKLAARMGSMENTMKAIAAALAKSEDEEEDDAPFEKAEKAVRKAKQTVRKAEEEDDEDEAEDAMEKADRALVAAKDALTKAEDAAKDDKDDERVEKAVKSFKVVKSALKALREKVATAKAAKAAAAAAAATAEPAPAAATVADVAKSHSELTEQLGVVTKSLAEVMQAVAAKAAPAQAAAANLEVLASPPVLVKAATPELLGTVAEAIDNAEDNGMATGLVMKSHSLLARLRSVEQGQLDRSVFDAELSRADDQVKNLFATA